MCSTDFQPAVIFDLAAVRARKPHRCDECAVDILPGEYYARVNALTDGYWWHGQRCAGCYFLCEAIETLECGDHGQILWGGGELEEEIRNMGSGAYDGASDEYAPNWAAVAFEAISNRRAVAL